MSLNASISLSLAALLFGLASDQPGQIRNVPQLFVSAERCMACHNGLLTPSGEDVSIGANWRASMMANSARDPYWQAAVRREVLDHPESRAAIENECAACHMPMARYTANAQGKLGTVFAHLPARVASQADQLALDGVSCAACHQIQGSNLGQPESFTAGFQVDETTPAGQRTVFGPFEVDAGRQSVMRSASGFQPAQSPHIQSSEVCATCHTLYTHALGPKGEAIGRLPEQAPYLEWKHSAFASSRSCQSCHMPEVEQEMPLTGVLGQPRKGFSRHSFRGGNFFMLRMLNLYRDELGVQALPEELDAAVQRTVQHLESETAQVRVENAAIVDGRLQADLTVVNLAGHKLPTAYPSRRVWIHFTVRDRLGQTVFESGAFQPSGAIAGNDNDFDPSRYEPHYRRIEQSDQVQIYESVMTDSSDAVTTGLLSAVGFVKDNRLLPEGFDKPSADKDIAVQGQAASDPDFIGGRDTIRYSVPVDPQAGPFSIEAELWYQPIAYRWAHNLGHYQAPEIERFVGYYESMSSGSALALARVVAKTGR